MQKFSISPIEMVASACRHNGLIWTMIRRDVAGRYRGSSLGMLWSLFNPILMLVIYTFVFSVVFKARWSTDGESKEQFALMLFAGLIFFNLFAECITRAPNLILGNVNYVKKVVFPLEVLPWITLGAALFHFLISLLVWLAACLLLTGKLHLTALLLPIVMLPLLLISIGLTWLIASLGVFLRDVAQVVGVIVSVMMFMSPIFYPVNALPETYQGILQANPLTPTIEGARKIMFFGEMPDWHQLGMLSLLSLVICWLGFAWFQKTRKGFADVL
ncbi:ABC transporter permease [Pseudomonas asiatica]|uniref:ABC transporter permease n=1 Tax=Pseudomonas asiatica TaxID=2219225 RepID=UPI00174B9DDA|nr:ABC transporter permease [Pseudomonas asiatica]QOE06514.1 ABC transporter permease [Pseudomonas asiatica]